MYELHAAGLGSFSASPPHNSSISYWSSSEASGMNGPTKDAAFPYFDSSYSQDLRKSHADCWGSQLFDHVLREHAVLDLIDGFSALVGQVLES